MNRSCQRLGAADDVAGGADGTKSGGMLVAATPYAAATGATAVDSDEALGSGWAVALMLTLSRGTSSAWQPTNALSRAP
jgi:hypothetical protein